MGEQERNDLIEDVLVRDERVVREIVFPDRLNNGADLLMPCCPFVVMSNDHVGIDEKWHTLVAVGRWNESRKICWRHALLVECEHITEEFIGVCDIEWLSFSPECFPREERIVRVMLTCVAE